MRAILNRLTREELLSDLEHQVQERTADLERERERSERLLRNMLPGVIARRMKDGEAIADTHEATVLFADIKGFTVLASERSANEVVAILDRIFSEFDAIAQKHGLEKIKTIGNSYMAAAGLPVPQPDHVDRAVLMGLDMIAAMPRLRDELDLTIDVRIGVHTGPVVAGVIGTQKYAYDIWGDTVNVASRMESHGEPGRLQVSDEVRQVLGSRYHLEDRGMIEIKNHNSMRTWFVLDIAPLGSGLKTMATSVRGEPRPGCIALSINRNCPAPVVTDASALLPTTLPDVQDERAKKPPAPNSRLGLPIGLEPEHPLCGLGVRGAALEPASHEKIKPRGQSQLNRGQHKPRGVHAQVG